MQELEKLQEEIETGQAPFDQQQKLTLEFYEKRINTIEEAIEKLKDAQLQIKTQNGLTRMIKEAIVLLMFFGSPLSLQEYN